MKDSVKTLELGTFGPKIGSVNIGLLGFKSKQKKSTSMNELNTKQRFSKIQQVIYWQFYNSCDRN